MTEREIFLAVLDLPDAAARTEYLDRVCSGDPARRARIESLLLSHDTADSFLGSPAVNPPAPDASATHEFSSAAAPDDANKADDDLAFLTPPGRPGSLGRIGHYEVLEVLGKGGFGIVFRAFDETLQRVVAIKVLSPHLAATSPARKRFLREARSSARVRHENVVRVYAVEEQPLPFLVMEFIPGETLQQRLDRTGPLETAEVVQFGRQIAEGLAAAHGMGLIHRDIKPGNILIEAGANPSIKITDFGLARAADDASLTQSGVVAGTPMFMAPEQAQGETLDHRADLFSLGSVLYTMASGRPPFRANNTLAVLKRVAEDTPRPIPEIIPEVPPWLCDLITRLHAKKPEDRIGTAKEVADLLGRGLAAMQLPANVPPAAVEKTPPPQDIPEAAPAIRRPRFRARRWAAAAAVLLLMVVGGLGFTEATGVTDVHGSVIRLFSPEGTLEIAVDDPEVSVKIDGSDVVITGAGPKEIRLKTGSHTVKASKDGMVVKQELVTVTKDGKQVVRISREAPSPDPKVAKSPDEASAWERSVAAMSAAEQVAAVAAKLKERNPGFDGQVTHKIEGGVVTEIDIGGLATNNVFDISPVRALVGLKSFGCDYTRHLSDLSPLKDMKLTELRLQVSQVTDLSPLKDMKLTNLYLYVTPVSDLSPLKDMKLTNLTIAMTQVTDLSLLRDMKLTHLDFGSTGVTDLSPLKDMKLTSLYFYATGVKDLSPLKGMPLQSLWGSNTGITDLKPLQGMPLKTLWIHNTGITDLKPLQGMPLEDIRLTPKNITQGLDILRDMKSLKTIGIENDMGQAWPAAEFWARYDKGEFKTDASAWERSVAAMPAEEQVKAVIARLKELNPDFDGKVEPTIENGVVTGLGFPKEHVSDISPVRVFTKLRAINIGQTQVSELTPLKGMPLRYLNLFCTPVSDLSPLKGMPLVDIQLMGSQVADMSPLKGMPLEVLYCSHTHVSDLSPLKGMPLRVLWINSEVSDLSPLKGMPLEHLGIGNSKVTDLSPLKGMPLRILTTGGSQVSDLSSLKGMPLEEFGLTPKNITQGLDILRDMKSLKTIDAMGQAWQAAEFWDRYDKGEFKK